MNLHPWINPEEIRDKLSRLIAIESVAERGFTEAQVAREVGAWCQEDGFMAELIEVSRGRPNLLVEFSGTRPGPVLLFEAHSDTVTAGDVSRWTRPPFQLTQEGDRLYGRGTADTKGNLVAAYVGIRALVQTTQGEFPGTIRFLVPIDEEGMMSGIRHFIASGRAADVDGAICCEPEDAQICISQKGALRLNIEIHGKMAHGAMPLTGNNPLPIMARFLTAMQEEEMHEQEAAGFDPYLGWPSITPTQVRAPLQGPSAFNVMPDAASVSLDIRTLADQSHKALVERIQARLDTVIREANRDLSAGRIQSLRERLEEPIASGIYSGEVIVVDDRPVTRTPIDHPLVSAMQAAVEERLGQPAVYAGVPGATDGTWLSSAGIPIVTIGAGNRFVPHQVDEWVSLGQLTDMAFIFAEAAYRFLTSSFHEERASQ